MTSKDNRPGDAAELRRRAEEIAREKAAQSPENLAAQSPEETRRTLHELRVHQIELEMQNEELRTAQAKLETAQAEAFLTQNDIFSRVLNSLDALVYVVDIKTYEILFINTYGQNIWGAIKGKICWQTIQAGQAGPCEFCTNSKLIGPDGNPTEGIVWEYQNTVNKRWYDCRDRAIYWPDGRMVRMEIATDITDRKRAEEERLGFEHQLQQLQRAESLNCMSGAVAHHFNNQLQAVMWNLEIAMEDPLRGESPVESLNAAMRAARKAAEVCNLLLTYVGQTVVEREPLDLSEACQRRLPMLRAALPKGVVLETDLLTPGPAISANANQIQKVLINLTTNAWEASGAGRGAIRLTVKTVSAADIPVAHRFPMDWQPPDTAYACLEVADAGCGIPDQHIEKLFDPFYSSKFMGRGLGLAVVLGIVRAHGGAITVESESARGSVFRVFLPVSAEAVPRKPVQVAQAPKTARGSLSACRAQAGTVLVVEDEPSMRTLLTLTLERLGFTVLAAQDGVEALEIFRQHRNEVGCVLCDLTMPRMNGWETLTALRKLAPGIPVILSSAYGEAQVMEGYHPELPQAVLSKPYDAKALINAISQILC